MAQLGLFARWGLFADKGKHAVGFWKFALRTRTEPVTPALFKECFGESMSAARNAMAWHLPLALEMEALRDVRPFTLPKIQLRAATQDEIAVCWSLWERLEALASEKDDPSTAALWRDRARARLDGLLQAGSTDPRLFTIRALLAVDLGDSEGAKTFLQRAVQQRVRFPSVYVELARLKLAETSSDRLEPGETAAILGLLTSARALRPILPAYYELAAETLRRSEPAAFTPEWRRALEEGVSLFPREQEMMTKIAAAFEAHDLKSEAEGVRRRHDAFMDETRANEL
jgi:hypothetical protein